MALEKAIPKDVANAARQHVKDFKGREGEGVVVTFSHTVVKKENLAFGFQPFFFIEAVGED